MSETVLVNPPISGRPGDPHTGIPFMPFILAYLAAALETAGRRVRVVDGLGSAPRRTFRSAGKRVRGLTPAEIVTAVGPGSRHVFLFARAVADHELIVEIARALRARRPNAVLIVVENSQAVTSFSLRFSCDQLFPHVDFAIVGECEESAVRLLDALDAGGSLEIPGVIRSGDGPGGWAWGTGRGIEVDMDRLGPPRWDLFPLTGYWHLGVGHGPVGGRYLAVLGSRGCPYPCTFCVVPDMSGRRWRGKAPVALADELEELSARHGVKEFHFEDLNSTVDRRRMQVFSQELARRQLGLTWKLVSGIKIETVDEETLRVMAASGCRYVSFSPESGSPRVLRAMKKGFDHDKAIHLTRVMARLGVHTQACFVLGYPGETEEDRRLTERFVRELVAAGLSEIALFVFTPIPGSEAFGLLDGYQSWSQLSFSPSWRADWEGLARFRRSLYVKFAAWKLRWQPAAVLRHALGLARRRFDTKMEMVAWRMLSGKG